MYDVTKTLVVDDDVLIRKVISEFLKQQGHYVLEAENGSVGLHVFRKDEPDLILVDLLMPVMGGLDFLAYVTKESPETPVIIVSGMGHFEDAVRALRLGAWDYLTKPIKDFNVLAHTINKALERAELLKEKRKYQEFLEREVKRRTLELEQTNQELIHVHRKLWDQLEQAQKMESVGVLAGGISHDFNNILASILCSAEVASEGIDKEKPEYEDLQRIIRVSQRGKMLVRRILTFTRKRTRTVCLFDIAENVRESIQFLKPILPSAIELVVECDRSVGNILGDPVQIQQILMNLVTNSVHALRDVPHPKLTIQLQRLNTSQMSNVQADMPVGECVKMRVIDNGKGISEDELKLIFDPLFTTKSDADGSGLGLYVVQEIVKSYKGKIDVSSSLGEGAEFNVYIPLIQEKLPVETSMQQKKIPKGWQTLLIVDDDTDMLDSLERILQNLGYKILKAADGELGYDVYMKNAESISLAILDQDVPRLNGIELSEKILAVNPLLPVIILTGRLEQEKEVFKNLPNIKKVLFKPVGKEILNSSIQSILSGIPMKDIQND